jgi:hypothetical protein
MLKKMIKRKRQDQRITLKKCGFLCVGGNKLYAYQNKGSHKSVIISTAYKQKIENFF